MLLANCDLYFKPCTSQIICNVHVCLYLKLIVNLAGICFLINDTWHLLLIAALLLKLCYAKGKRDLRPNETSRFEANFHSRHFDKARPWQSNRERIRVQINQVLPTQKYSLHMFVEFDTSYCFICFRLCFVFTYKTTVGIFTKSCVSLFTLP